VDVFQWPSWGATALFALGVVGAIMTAFYMSRLVFGMFWGDFRGWKIVKNFKPTHDEHHDDEHAPSKKLKGPAPHESPWPMTVPLVILGALSIVGGLISAHLLQLHWLDDWLAPVFARATPAVAAAEGGGGAVVLAAGLGAFAIGTGLAYWIYIAQRGAPAKSLAEQFPGLHRLVYDKWRIDELYEETVIGAVDSLAEASVLFDKYVVDGIVAKATAFGVKSVGAGLRLIQTGRVQTYAAAMVVGLFALGWFLVAPHARAHTVMAAPGSYRIEAAPGFGYSYQWDADGDGKWDSEEFGDNRTVSLNVDYGQSKKVRFKVKNAFGRTSEREVEVARDKRDPHRQQPTTTIEVEHLPDGTVRPRLPGGGRPPTLPPAPGDPRVDQ
jgi:NADH-quinone oxidoreductase subunit L